MFDVSWTDPSRETVGERRNRKKNNESLGEENEKSTSSSTSSISNGSHGNSRPSFLGLFAGPSVTNNGKKAIKRSDSHSKVTALRDQEKSEKTSRRISSYTITSNGSESENTGPSPTPLTNFFDVEPFLQSRKSNHFDGEHSSTSDGDAAGSVFSDCTGRSGKTESTWSSFMDTPATQKNSHKSIGTSSFVTQYTDITVSPRASVKADEQIARLVCISPPPLPVQIKETIRKHYVPPLETDCRKRALSRPESIGLPSSPLLGKDSDIESWPVPPSARQSTQCEPPEAWEFPDVLDPLENASPVMLGPPLVPVKSLRRRLPPLELTHLQRNIRRMDVASSKIVLERLKEEWLHVTDASVYRDMEVEKQLWMLTALEHLKRKDFPYNNEQVSEATIGETPPITKLLSLYENHASASFLSAIKPQPRIHHISTSPLSPSFFPNIHPLAVSVATTQLPYASNLFSAIHAFSLPSILPASAIPDMLKECHRTLRSSKPPPAALPFSVDSTSPDSPVSLSSTRTVIPPRSRERQNPGSIHLTIIDPAPIPETLGPKLRSWLDTHLILNLERHFKCVNPSRLFPIWLADAKLRGEGSTIVNVHFRAVLPDQVEEPELKDQLKSVVGRALWKDLWGSSVAGERWWWEDDEIVEECLKLGTRWEWAVIESVKED